LRQARAGRRRAKKLWLVSNRNFRGTRVVRANHKLLQSARLHQPAFHVKRKPPAPDREPLAASRFGIKLNSRIQPARIDDAIALAISTPYTDHLNCGRSRLADAEPGDDAAQHTSRIRSS
jgi:hypothetical protein